MDDHAVADDAVDPLAENAGGDQRELVGHPLVNDRVPRVGPSLVPHDDVVLVAEQVDNLPLRLITPLETHDARRAHGIPLRSNPDDDRARSLGIVKLQVNAGNLRRQSRQGIPGRRCRLVHTRMDGGDMHLFRVADGSEILKFEAPTPFALVFGSLPTENDWRPALTIHRW